MYAKASARRSQRDAGMSSPDDIISLFWQKWLEQEKALYRCCLKLMNWNQTEAEEALHEAMIKASKKVQEYAGKIANLGAWLYQLTRNHCLDIIKKRSLEATAVESIEWVGDGEDIATVTPTETPEQALETDEKYTKIYEAIASLPELLRSTYILHFYENLKHPEIAEIQGISYDNVCKRISRARKIIETKLSGYFLGEEEEAGRKASARKLSLTPPSQGEKLSRPERDSHRESQISTSEEANECVQVVVELKPVKGKIEPKEIEREKISEPHESGIQPMDNGGPGTPLATASAEEETTIVSAKAKEQEVVKLWAPEMTHVQEILVKGEIEAKEIEREKISAQAIESGYIQVDTGRPGTALATTSAEKLTRIVLAQAKEQEVVKLWAPEMPHVQEILVPSRLARNKSAPARSTQEKWYRQILAATLSAFRKICQGQDLDRTIAGSTVTSSVAIAQQSYSIGYSPPVVARSVQQEKSALARGDPGFEGILGVGATESIDRWCKVVRPDRAWDREEKYIEDRPDHGDLVPMRDRLGLHQESN